MSAQAKAIPEKGCIWRGFSQTWGYNHRMNRLGDFVKTDGKYECDSKKFDHNSPISIHTAASGSGKDNAKFVSYFSVIKSHNLKFIEKIEMINLEGKENEKIIKNISLSVKLEKNLSATIANYTVLLNGFDIFADDSGAKKPINFEVAVRDVSINKLEHTLNFKIYVEFQAACSSAECWHESSVVDYKLIVYYIIISTNNALNQVVKKLSRKVVWGKKELSSIPDYEDYSKLEIINDEIQGRKDVNFDMAFLGIKGFSFRMSGEFHFLKWCQFIIPKNYNPETGKINFDCGLHYQTWEKGMKHYYKSTGVDVTFSPAGNAKLQLEIALIQFNSNSTSKVFNNKRAGTIHWEGGNNSAKGCDAINCSIIE